MSVSAKEVDLSYITAAREASPPTKIRQDLLSKPKEALAISAAAIFLTMGDAHSLDVRGKYRYMEVMHRVINGEPVHLHKEARILAGKKVFVRGEEKLRNLDGSNLVVVGNHLKQEPINGIWGTILASYFIGRNTGKETRWVLGSGGNALADYVHKALGKSINAIQVKDGDLDGMREIYKAIKNGEPVGIYPEGDQKDKMLQGYSGSGVIIGRALESYGTEVVTFACETDSQKNLFLSLDRMDTRELLDAKRSTKGHKKDVGQAVIDRIMGNIAKSVRPENRGYYCNVPDGDSNFFDHQVEFYPKNGDWVPRVVELKEPVLSLNVQNNHGGIKSVFKLPFLQGA